MKLEPAKAAVLVEILNAQSGVKPLEDKEAYKAKLAEVADLLNTKDGKAVGGIKKEVYDANKDNAELVAAAKAHLDKAKERAAKAASKETAAPKEPKLRSPEEEEASAKAIVAYMNAVTGKARITKEEDGKQVDDPEGFRTVANKSRKYIDHKKGGLLNEAPEGKKTPYERFKDFPGVVEACKAHRVHVKNKAKEAAGPEMA